MRKILDIIVLIPNLPFMAIFFIYFNYLLIRHFSKCDLVDLVLNYDDHFNEVVDKAFDEIPEHLDIFIAVFFYGYVIFINILN